MSKGRTFLTDIPYFSLPIVSYFPISGDHIHELIELHMKALTPHLISREGK